MGGVGVVASTAGGATGWGPAGDGGAGGGTSASAVAPAAAPGELAGGVSRGYAGQQEESPARYAKALHGLADQLERTIENGRAAAEAFGAGR